MKSGYRHPHGPYNGLHKKANCPSLAI